MSLGAERQADVVTFSNVWVKAAGTISGQMWRMEVKKGPPSSQPLTHCLAKKEALSNICLLRHKAARNTLSACLLMPNSMNVMAFQLQLPLNLSLSEKPHVCCGTFTREPRAAESSRADTAAGAHIHIWALLFTLGLLFLSNLLHLSVLLRWKLPQSYKSLYPLLVYSLQQMPCDCSLRVPSSHPKQ